MSEENKITPEVINKLSLEESEEKLLKSVGEEKENNGEISNELSVEDIHPNLLQGLFPMYGPVGIGVNGETIRAESICLDIPENMERAVDKFNLQLISYCVETAKLSGWKYFYRIWYFSNQLIIRGC